MLVIPHIQLVPHLEEFLCKFMHESSPIEEMCNYHIYLNTKQGVSPNSNALHLTSKYKKTLLNKLSISKLLLKTACAQ